MQLDAVEYPIGSGTYISVGLGTDYNGGLLIGGAYTSGSALQRQTMRNANDLLRFITINGRDIPMSFFRDPNSSVVTSTVWNQNLRTWFDPGAGRSGTRYLRFLLDDGVTLARLPVHVTSLGPRSDMFDAFDVVVTAIIPYLETITATTTVVTTSGTLTNNGTVRAQPQIQITGAGVVAGKSVTLTDTTGNGLVSYPIAVPAGGTPTSECWVLLNGTPVPFQAVTTNVVLYVDLPASGTALVTILLATGVTNALFNTLDAGNLNLAATTGQTSSSGYAWNTSVITTAPAGRCGVWTPETILTTSQPSAAGYAITAEAAGGITFTLSNPASGAVNDANAMTVFAGSTIGALTGVSRVTTNHTTGVTSFVRYRAYGASSWVTAWSTTANATVTTSITGSTGDEVAIGTQYTMQGAPAVTASIVTISLANPTLVTTSGAHGFVTGDTVTIANSTSTPTINGSQVVTVKSDTTFTVPVNVTTAGSGGTATRVITPTNGATLTINISSTAAQLTNGPSQSPVSVTYTVLNGTISNSTTGQTLTFTNFMFANGLLTIDATARQESRAITTPSGPTLGGWTATDPVDLFSLAPGANSVTESVAGTVTFVYRDTWS